MRDMRAEQGSGTPGDVGRSGRNAFGRQIWMKCIVLTDSDGVGELLPSSKGLYVLLYYISIVLTCRHIGF